MTRIISGILKGLQVSVPEGEETRPTKAAVREAIFNSLGDKTQDSTFFDLYAGTGSIGLEAASWGAQKVFFVEKKQSIFEILEKNLRAASIKLERDTTASLQLVARCSDAESFLMQGSESFDILFFDPPYDQTLIELEKTLPFIGKRCNKNSVLVVERKKKTHRAEDINSLLLGFGWLFKKNKSYGIARIDYFEKAD